MFIGGKGIKTGEAGGECSGRRLCPGEGRGKVWLEGRERGAEGPKKTLKEWKGIRISMRNALILAGILLVLLAGCAGSEEEWEIQPERVGSADSEYETVFVSGVERGGMVGSEKKMVLIVSGMDNDVWVIEGTQLSEITVTGTGNDIHIAGSHHPRISKSGLDNNILRYN